MSAVDIMPGVLMEPVIVKVVTKVIQIPNVK